MEPDMKTEVIDEMLDKTVALEDMLENVRSDIWGTLGENINLTNDKWKTLKGDINELRSFIRDEVEDEEEAEKLIKKVNQFQEIASNITDYLETQMKEKLGEIRDQAEELKDRKQEFVREFKRTVENMED